MSYRSEVLADSPLGYWRMNDVNGSTTMVAVTGTNGTHVNPTAVNQGQITALTNDATDSSIKYNGTNQYSTVALNLSGQTRISFEFWAYAPSYSADDKLWFEFGSSAYIASNGFVIDPNSGAASSIFYGMGLSTGSLSWTDTVRQASAGSWHHYVFDMNRATPANLAYIDGQLQVSVTSTHNAGTYGAYGNTTLYFACRTGTTLFSTPNTVLDEVAIYSGGLSATRVAAHYAAALKSSFNNYQSVKAGNGMSTGERIR